MEITKIILKPIITEKSLSGHQFGRYTFRVHQDATKTLIAKAIDQVFGVKAVKVTISITKPTTRVNNKRRHVTIPGFKKATVFVEEGKTISIFEEPKEEKTSKKIAKKKTVKKETDK